MTIIPAGIALSFHSTHKHCNVEVRDAATHETLFVDGLQEVGRWLRAYQFQYAVGTQAKWYRTNANPA